MSISIFQVINLVALISIICYAVYQTIRFAIFIVKLKKERNSLDGQLKEMCSLFCNGDEEMQEFYKYLNELVMLSVDDYLTKEELENINENYNFYLNVLDKIRTKTPILRSQLLTFCELHIFYVRFVDKYREFIKEKESETEFEKFTMIDLKNANFVAGLN